MTLWLYGEIILGAITIMLFALWIAQLLAAQPRRSSSAIAGVATATLDRSHTATVGLFVPQPSAPAACAQCGMTNREGAGHCRHCGSGLKVAPTDTAAPEHAFLRSAQGRIVNLAEHTTIGSASSNTLVLNDPSISKCHAEIVRRQGSYILIDCSSTNGSFVDDRRAFRNRLRPGVRVRFGQVEWIFQIEAGRPDDAERTT